MAERAPSLLRINSSHDGDAIYTFSAVVLGFLPLPPRMK